MTLIIEAQPLPLMLDADGVVRVGNTRVTLDTIVDAFSDGATVEEIVQQYPSLSLSDVYSVIGYYLHQPEKVNRYLQRRQQTHEQVKAENEARFDPVGIRDRLLNRQSQTTGS